MWPESHSAEDSQKNIKQFGMFLHFNLCIRNVVVTWYFLSQVKQLRWQTADYGMTSSWKVSINFMFISDWDHREEPWQLPLRRRDPSPKIIHFYGLFLFPFWNHLDSHPSKATVSCYFLEPSSLECVERCIISPFAGFWASEGLALATLSSSRGIFPETGRRCKPCSVGSLCVPWCLFTSLCFV